MKHIISLILLLLCVHICKGADLCFSSSSNTCSGMSFLTYAVVSADNCISKCVFDNGNYKYFHFAVSGSNKYCYCGFTCISKSTSPIGTGDTYAYNGGTCPVFIITAVVTPTPATCNGLATGKASVVASGSSSGYTYAWKDSNNNPLSSTTSTAAGLVAGTYTVVVSASGFTSVTESVTITQPAALTYSYTLTSAPVCPGDRGMVDFTFSGGTPDYTLTYTGLTAQSTIAPGTTLTKTFTPDSYTLAITDSNSCTSSTTSSNPLVITAPTAFVVTPSSTHVTCPGGNNGAASVSVSGGTGPYAYTWSNGATGSSISGLTAGTYTVTVVDNLGCSPASTPITISQPAAFVTTPAHVDVSCHGLTDGTAAVSITGGSSSYTYTWSNGQTTQAISNLGGGQYTVDLKDSNNCPIPSVTITVIDPLAISASFQSHDIVCNGGTGSAQVTASGGTGTLTYWSNGGSSTSSMSGLAAGSYNVVVKDANLCTSSTLSFTITNPPLLTHTWTSTDAPCNGGVGSATIVISGGEGPYTYAWSPNFGTSSTANSLSAGTYSVQVTDARTCSINPSVTITQPAVTTSSIAFTPVDCYGATTGTATATVTGGTQPYVYTWSNGQSTPTATGLAVGSISVQFTDANGCPITTRATTVTGPVDITFSQSNTDITCNSQNDGSASITGVAGGTGPYTYTWTTGSTTASVSGLSSGTYSVVIKDSHLCTKTADFTLTQPDALTAVTTSQQYPQCYGGITGTVSINPVGGKAPFTYSWSPFHSTASSLSGLAVGTYGVEVTDSCAVTKSVVFSVTQPNVLQLLPQQTNVACHGTSTGTATVYAEGGVGPYTYAWTPSGGSASTAHDLAAGTYTVTVTDVHGCSESLAFVITQPDEMVVTPTITHLLCKGYSNGAVSLSVAGGSDRYVYQWAPSTVGVGSSISNIKAGAYKVVVTDTEFCSKTQAIVVNEPSQLTLTGTQVDVACNGGSTGSATVVASGGVGGYMYSWAPSGGSSTTASGLAVGTYVVTVTDANGCVATQSFTIVQPALLTATGLPVNVACRGGSTGSATVVASGGAGGYTYSWASRGETTPSIFNLSVATYLVTVTDSNSCNVNQSITLTQPAPYCVHGTCQGLQLCRCEKGWGGLDCSKPLCDTPCLNNGTCSAPFTCTCPSEWTGPVCGISTAATSSVKYVVNLVQVFKANSTVSISTYVSLLATALNISVDSIVVKTETMTMADNNNNNKNSNKRSDPTTYTKLTCTISLQNTGSSQNRTEEMVLEAASSTSVREYLNENGSDSSMNTPYIDSSELRVEYPPTTPPNNKDNNGRKRRLGLGLGLGLGLPVVAAGVVGFAYMKKKNSGSKAPADVAL